MITYAFREINSKLRKRIALFEIINCYISLRNFAIFLFLHIYNCLYKIIKRKIQKTKSPQIVCDTIDKMKAYTENKILVNFKSIRFESILESAFYQRGIEYTSFMVHRTVDRRTTSYHLSQYCHHSKKDYKIKFFYRLFITGFLYPTLYRIKQEYNHQQFYNAIYI